MAFEKGTTFENRMTTPVRFGKYKNAGKTYGDLLNGDDGEAGWVVWLYKEEKKKPNPNFPVTWATDLEFLILQTERRLNIQKEEVKAYKENMDADIPYEDGGVPF
jgi:hypothetical protein